MPQGRVEVYTEDATLVTVATGDFNGHFHTQNLEPGTYYPLLYNGDAQFFIGWFSQWYGGAPLLRSDRAQGVVVSTGNVFGVDAMLLPLYDDMFDSVFEERASPGCKRPGSPKGAPLRSIAPMTR